MDVPAIAAVILGLLAIFFVLRPLFGRGAGPIEEEAGSPLEKLMREKDGIYLAMREVEFDRRTEVVSEEDYRALIARYRARAIALMKEIDGLEAAGVGALTGGAALPAGANPSATAAARRCAGCDTDNAEEHRFCIRCGRPLPGAEGGAGADPAGRTAP
jgi:hypothetical protein